MKTNLKSANLSLEENIEQVRFLYEQGEYSKAFDFITLLPNSSETNIIKLWSFLFSPYSRIFDEIISQSQINNMLIVNSGNTFLRLCTALAKAKILLEEINTIFRDDKYQDLQKLLSSSVELYNNLISDSNTKIKRSYIDEMYLMFLEIKAFSITFEKKFDEALNLLFEGLKIAEKYQFSIIIHQYYYRISYVYQMIGNLKKCVEWGLLRLELADQLNNKYWRIADYNSIGVYYGWQGKKESITYLEKGIKLVENYEGYGRLLQWIILNSNLGGIKIENGKLEEGKKILENTKILLEEGFISGTINQKLFNTILAEILKDLFNYSYSIGNDDQCLKYLSEFSSHSNDLTDIGKNKYYLSRALFLMKKGRINDKSKAFSLLTEIINSQSVWFETTYPALMLLTQLLLEDYENTHDSGIILEINTYMKQLLSKTDSIQFNVLLAILNSKLMLLEGNIDKAEELLVKNLKLADENGYLIQKQAISNELNKLRLDKSKWNDILLKNPKVFEILHFSEFKSYLNEAKSIMAYSK